MICRPPRRRSSTFRTLSSIRNSLLPPESSLIWSLAMDVVQTLLFQPHSWGDFPHSFLLTIFRFVRMGSHNSFDLTPTMIFFVCWSVLGFRGAG
uniref:Uncharacterized protein n=1 Tax=Physcomitrium patens TaxID=3218 RepID=A0A2K1L725_PHYPA|nr:hypothetical protein PHYPA_000215 [Physcomitrium patens]